MAPIWQNFCWKKFCVQWRLELVCCEKNEFDTQKFETFLKNEFGKILTIKKD